MSAEPQNTLPAYLGAMAMQAATIQQKMDETSRPNDTALRREVAEATAPLPEPLRSVLTAAMTPPRLAVERMSFAVRGDLARSRSVAASLGFLPSDPLCAAFSAETVTHSCRLEIEVRRRMEP